jgi:hypothetical protein
LISYNFSANVANFVPNFVVKFKSSYWNSQARMWTKPLIGPLTKISQLEALFTYGLVNFIMNFWTSQRSSERSSQLSRKSYIKSTVNRCKATNLKWLTAYISNIVIVCLSILFCKNVLKNLIVEIIHKMVWAIVITVNKIWNNFQSIFKSIIIKISNSYIKFIGGKNLQQKLSSSEINMHVVVPRDRGYTLVVKYNLGIPAIKNIIGKLNNKKPKY